MFTTQDKRDKEKIRRIIKEINLSWTKGEPENLNKYFHKDIIIATPNLQIIGQGKRQCVQSYIDFLAQAKMRFFTPADPKIFIWGNTALALYSYNIEWESQGQIYKDNGQEFFIFIKEKQSWLAVWRQLMSSRND